ncbi:MAG: aminotransferase class I/II-fold pyridoxal phosphate-dependent enzyme, partial [Faecalibacillus sp.]
QQIKTLKSNIDYGMFLPIQMGAIAALNSNSSLVEKTRAAYLHRRDLLCQGCQKIGWHFDIPKGTMFVWAKIPDHFSSSEDFYQTLFDKTGVLVVPGNAFGSEGEGYVRMALVQDDQTIYKALDLMNKSGIFKQ